MKLRPLLLCLLFSPGITGQTLVTVPFVLDHNRMLVEAEVLGLDGNFARAVLWIDTGNPDFLVSGEFAEKLGLISDQRAFEPPPPAPLVIRIGGKVLISDTIRTTVGTGIPWLFHTMHNDANIPSTLLCKYHVIFDYPEQRLTVADPGVMKPRGEASKAVIHPVTGIVQIDAEIEGEQFSFALDNGASCSFITDSVVNRMIAAHPEWSHCTGAAGCANIWGRWKGESEWPLVRVPEVRWGKTAFRQCLIAGLPGKFRGGTDVGTWYSKKTVRKVDGFLGPNVFRNYRVEIDYTQGAVWFEQGGSQPENDMDMVGLTLSPMDDGSYLVAGILKVNGLPAVEGVAPGDRLLAVDSMETAGKTMGAVVDALRGPPGTARILRIMRDNREIVVPATTARIL